MRPNTKADGWIFSKWRDGSTTYFGDFPYTGGKYVYLRGDARLTSLKRSTEIQRTFEELIKMRFHPNHSMFRGKKRSNKKTK